MAALTTAQEYAAIREAIQKLTTLDENGERRDKVAVSVDGMSISYASNQLQSLQNRETELARRLTIRNARKRTVSSFGGGKTYLGL
jgi:hypothetical protein